MYVGWGGVFVWCVCVCVCMNFENIKGNLEMTDWTRERVIVANYYVQSLLCTYDNLITIPITLQLIYASKDMNEKQERPQSCQL